MAIEVDGFTLGGQSAVGTYGETFFGHTSPPDGTPCAVKRLCSMAIDRAFFDETHHHLRDLGEHPGIVPVLDWNTKDSPFWIASALQGNDSQPTLTGSSLLESFSGGDDAVDLLLDLAKTMGVFHAKGILHGNLHPGNIFAVRTESGDIRIRVGDFGQAFIGKAYHVPLTRESLPSLAPDQLSRPEEFSTPDALRWDVYAFGVLAFRLLTGKIPRGAEYIAKYDTDCRNHHGGNLPLDPEQFVRHIEKEGDLRFPDDGIPPCDGRLKTLILECLSMSPQSRPGDGGEVFQRLRVIAQSPNRSKKWKRSISNPHPIAAKLLRSRAAALASAALFIVAVLPAMAALFRSDPTAEDESAGMEEKPPALDANHLAGDLDPNDNPGAAKPVSKTVELEAAASGKTHSAGRIGSTGRHLGTVLEKRTPGPIYTRFDPASKFLYPPHPLPDPALEKLVLATAAVRQSLQFHPGDTHLLNAAAESFYQLALRHLEHQLHAPAIASLQRCLEFLSLLEERTALTEAQQFLAARAYSETGSILYELGRIEEATDIQLDALGVLLELTDSAPDTPEFEAELGACFSELAQLIETLVDQQSAPLGDPSQMISEAELILAAVLHDHPCHPHATLALAHTHLGQSKLALVQSHSAEAVQHIGKAIDRFAELVDCQAFEPKIPLRLHHSDFGHTQHIPSHLRPHLALRFVREADATLQHMLDHQFEASASPQTIRDQPSLTRFRKKLATLIARVTRDKATPSNLVDHPGLLAISGEATSGVRP